MSADSQEWIHAYLDGHLTEEQIDEFGAWLVQSPDHAQQFAKTALLHDALRNRFRAQAELAGNASPFSAPRQMRPSSWKGVAFLASAAVVAIFAVALLHEFWGDSALAAERELKRLIQAAERITDRTYVIAALDEGDPQKARGFDLSKKKGQPQPPIDGAILHTRGLGQYVLVRKFADGSEFLTGSDGTTSWSLPPMRDGKKGQVRVSKDPLRFRGPVPGQQHNIPFLDIGGSLDQLGKAYKLTTLPSKASPGGDGSWLGLRAERREHGAGGPREVEIWYSPETGVVQQMRFGGMPQARGGPRSLLMELTEQRDLGPNFFDHSAHHGPERQVISSDD